MRTHRWTRCFFATVPFALAALAASAGSVANVDRYVAVHDLQVDDGTITGTLANLSTDQITQVRLLVSDRFLWRDEQSPGPDDPSRGRVETLDVVVAPGASVPFRIDRAPLPQRTDGRFVTEVRPIRVETLELPSDPATPAAAVPIP
jgi:hypothetical protein